MQKIGLGRQTRLSPAIIGWQNFSRWAKWKAAKDFRLAPTASAHAGPVHAPESRVHFPAYPEALPRELEESAMEAAEVPGQF